MVFSCLTEDEVRYKYKKADDKEMMIKVLADLTVSTVDEMTDFLGVTSQKQNGRKRCFLDQKLARKYYDAGMFDTEISKAMGVSKHTIKSWRERKGLISNYYKGDKIGEK